MTSAIPQAFRNTIHKHTAASGKQLEIWVRTCGGPTKLVWLDRDAYLSEIYLQLYFFDKIPPDKYYICLGGKCLVLHKNLGEQGVSFESVLSCRLRGRGGMTREEVVEEIQRGVPSGTAEAASSEGDREVEEGTNRLYQSLEDRAQPQPQFTLPYPWTSIRYRLLDDPGDLMEEGRGRIEYYNAQRDMGYILPEDKPYGIRFNWTLRPKVRVAPIFRGYPRRGDIFGFYTRIGDDQRPGGREAYLIARLPDIRAHNSSEVLETTVILFSPDKVVYSDLTVRVGGDTRLATVVRQAQTLYSIHVSGQTQFPLRIWDFGGVPVGTRTLLGELSQERRRFLYVGWPPPGRDMMGGNQTIKLFDVDLPFRQGVRAARGGEQLAFSDYEWDALQDRTIYTQIYDKERWIVDFRENNGRRHRALFPYDARWSEVHLVGGNILGIKSEQVRLLYEDDLYNKYTLIRSLPNVQPQFSVILTKEQTGGGLKSKQLHIRIQAESLLCRRQGLFCDDEIIVVEGTWEGVEGTLDSFQERPRGWFVSIAPGVDLFHIDPTKLRLRNSIGEGERQLRLNAWELWKEVDVLNTSGISHEPSHALEWEKRYLAWRQIELLVPASRQPLIPPRAENHQGMPADCCVLHNLFDQVKDSLLPRLAHNWQVSWSLLGRVEEESSEFPVGHKEELLRLNLYGSFCGIAKFLDSLTKELGLEELFIPESTDVEPYFVTHSIHQFIQNMRQEARCADMSNQQLTPLSDLENCPSQHGVWGEVVSTQEQSCDEPVDMDIVSEGTGLTATDQGITKKQEQSEQKVEFRLVLASTRKRVVIPREIHMHTVGDLMTLVSELYPLYTEATPSNGCDIIPYTLPLDEFYGVYAGEATLHPREVREDLVDPVRDQMESVDPLGNRIRVRQVSRSLQQTRLVGNLQEILATLLHSGRSEGPNSLNAGCTIPPPQEWSMEEEDIATSKYMHQIYRARDGKFFFDELLCRPFGATDAIDMGTSLAFLRSLTPSKTTTNSQQISWFQSEVDRLPNEIPWKRRRLHLQCHGCGNSDSHTFTACMGDCGSKLCGDKSSLSMTIPHTRHLACGFHQRDEAHCAMGTAYKSGGIVGDPDVWNDAWYEKLCWTCAFQPRWSLRNKYLLVWVPFEGKWEDGILLRSTSAVFLVFVKKGLVAKVVSRHKIRLDTRMSALDRYKDYREGVSKNFDSGHLLLDHQEKIPKVCLWFDTHGEDLVADIYEAFELAFDLPAGQIKLHSRGGILENRGRISETTLRWKDVVWASTLTLDIDEGRQHPNFSWDARSQLYERLVDSPLEWKVQDKFSSLQVRRNTRLFAWTDQVSELWDFRTKAMDEHILLVRSWDNNKCFALLATPPLNTDFFLTVAASYLSDGRQVSPCSPGGTFIPGGTPFLTSRLLNSKDVWIAENRQWIDPDEQKARLASWNISRTFSIRFNAEESFDLHMSHSNFSYTFFRCIQDWIHSRKAWEETEELLIWTRTVSLHTEAVLEAEGADSDPVELSEADRLRKVSVWTSRGPDQLGNLVRSGSQIIWITTGEMGPRSTKTLKSEGPSTNPLEEWIKTETEATKSLTLLHKWRYALSAAFHESVILERGNCKHRNRQGGSVGRDLADIFRNQEEVHRQEWIRTKQSLVDLHCFLPNLAISGWRKNRYAPSPLQLLLEKNLQPVVIQSLDLCKEIDMINKIVRDWEVGEHVRIVSGYGAGSRARIVKITTTMVWGKHIPAHKVHYAVEIEEGRDSCHCWKYPDELAKDTAFAGSTDYWAKQDGLAFRRSIINEARMLRRQPSIDPRDGSVLVIGEGGFLLRFSRTKDLDVYTIRARVAARHRVDPTQVLLYYPGGYLKNSDLVESLPSIGGLILIKTRPKLRGGSIIDPQFEIASGVQNGGEAPVRLLEDMRSDAFVLEHRWNRNNPSLTILTNASQALKIPLRGKLRTIPYWRQGDVTLPLASKTLFMGIISMSFYFIEVALLSSKCQWDRGWLFKFWSGTAVVLSISILFPNQTASSIRVCWQAVKAQRSDEREAQILASGRVAQFAFVWLAISLVSTTCLSLPLNTEVASVGSPVENHEQWILWAPQLERDHQADQTKNESSWDWSDETVHSLLAVVVITISILAGSARISTNCDIIIQEELARTSWERQILEDEGGREIFARGDALVQQVTYVLFWTYSPTMVILGFLGAWLNMLLETFRDRETGWESWLEIPIRFSMALWGISWSPFKRFISLSLAGLFITPLALLTIQSIIRVPIEIYGAFQVKHNYIQAIRRTLRASSQIEDTLEGRLGNMDQVPAEERVILASRFVSKLNQAAEVALQQASAEILKLQRAQQEAFLAKVAIVSKDMLGQIISLVSWIGTTLSGCFKQFLQVSMNLFPGGWLGLFFVRVGQFGLAQVRSFLDWITIRGGYVYRRGESWIPSLFRNTSPMGRTVKNRRWSRNAPLSEPSSSATRRKDMVERMTLADLEHIRLRLHHQFTLITYFINNGEKSLAEAAREMGVGSRGLVQIILVHELLTTRIPSVVGTTVSVAETNKVIQDQNQNPKLPGLGGPHRLIYKPKTRRLRSISVSPLRKWGWWTPILCFQVLRGYTTNEIGQLCRSVRSGAGKRSTGVDTNVVGSQKTRSYCHQFRKRGWCNFGENCWFQHDHGPPKKKPDTPEERQFKISGHVNWLLRHEIPSKINRGEDGYVKVDDLLANRTLRNWQVTLPEIIRLTVDQVKKRFVLKEVGGIKFMRTNQGHGQVNQQKILLSSLGELVTLKDKFDMVVHATSYTNRNKDGTTTAVWDNILREGLRLQNRQSFHFSTSNKHLKTKHKLLMHFDWEEAIGFGVQFYKSGDGTSLLSRGLRVKGATSKAERWVFPLDFVTKVEIISTGEDIWPNARDTWKKARRSWEEKVNVDGPDELFFSNQRQ